MNRLLSETRVDNSNNVHTHVLVGGMRGKINIGTKRAVDFWETYSQELNKGTNLFLAEKPLSEVPVLVDVDLKTRGDVVKDLYTLDQVRRIVKTYQTVLKEVLFEDVPTDALTCVLLQKSPRLLQEDVTYIKHGFHLHFPKCFINVNIQKAYLIPIVSKRLEGMFDHLYTLDDGHCTSSDDDASNQCITADKKGDVHYKFLDGASVVVHWLMYGSKKQDSEPFLATKCFSGTCEEISFEDALGDYVLPKLYGQSSAVKCHGNVMELLPRILSTRLHGREFYYYKAKPSVNTPIVDNLSKQFTKRTPFAQKTISETLESIEELLPLLSDKRADDRSDWLAVGFCLHGITEGDAEGLSLWLEFSDRSEKCDEAECICIWSNMKNERTTYTIGTLKYFAKLDSPEEYAALCRKQGDKLIGKAVEGGHNDIAKLLHNEYANEFVFSTTNSMWYQFRDHIWHEDKTCFALSERISDDNGTVISQFNGHIRAAKIGLKRLGRTEEMPPKKRKKRKDDEDEDDEDEDDNTADILRSKIFALTKLIKQCKQSGFKTAVMKECQEVFRNPRFTISLNINPHLMAFTNGVYDFKNDSFRDGKPEDFLSVRAPIPYKDYRSMDDPEVQEVADFFRKVLPDDDVRRYFLEQACQLFIGGNRDKVFCIWTGSGDNGKTITQKLFEKMLGKDLAVKISTALITGEKSKMGQAAPELARTGNGVRWVVMDEPSQDEQITTGQLKALTGNDSFFARDLYEGGKGTKEIVPLFKLHMLCNSLPAIRKPDEACWERVRVFPFESKFLPEDKCPATVEEQFAKKIFPRDPDFTEKIDRLLQPFAWYLVYFLRCLNRKNRVIPDKVRIATSMYKEENNSDPAHEFKDDELEKDPRGELTVDEVFVRYREWWRSNYSGDKFTTAKKAAIVTLSRILGNVSEIVSRGGVRKKVFKGYSWRKTDDYDEDEVVVPKIIRRSVAANPML